jgi:hypothetical protein
MKTFLFPVRLIVLLACVTLSTSCYTTYDSYGNARQSVDPGVALIGVAAAGLVGYALADDSHHGHHGHSNYYGGYSYYGGGYGYGGGYSHCY